MNKDMNNNIIKSLRRTLLCTVAAAAVTIGFTACADEMFETQNVTAPANGNGYKINIAANIGSGDTRAVAYNSETGGYDGTFETSDFIYVYDITKNAEGRKKYEGSDWWGPTYLTPDANGKKVNLVGELSFCAWDSEAKATVEITPGVGDELMLYYKNTGPSIYYNNWSGETIQDYAIAKVTILSIDDNGVIKTSAATFTHPQSLYKINFTGIASGVKIETISIKSEQQKLVSEYNPTNIQWPNYFGNVKYYYNDNKKEGTGQRELFFMLRFADNPYNKDKVSSSGDAITFKALGSDGHYYTGSKIVQGNLTDGKYYQAEVAMDDAGLAMTLTNNSTGEVVVLDSYTQIHSNQAPYTLEHNGYDLDLEWDGGENPLTFKNISLSTPYEGFRLFPDQSDPDNTKNHYLVLEGENTLYCDYEGQGIKVLDGSSLYVSAKSAKDKLNITQGVIRLNNATMTLESGEITVNGYIEMYDNSTIKVEGGVLTANTLYGWNSSCIISKGGKLRIAKNSYISEGLIKAAEGYTLVVNDDGEYWAYTAIEDDGSGLAKSIVVMPGAVTLTYGLSDWGGEELRAYVYPETTKDQSVTWKTSNPDVVEVYGEGKIRATGVGVATVTATTKDGTNLSAECIVTVKPVGGIMYENDEVSVTPESKPFINPITKAGKITSITYTSSDTSVATVNASTGEVTIASGATAGQTVTITASATVEEDDEYFYPEYRMTDKYTVKLVPVTSQGERNDYTPGSW
jgi:uncharacterized protein YjdB